MADDHVSIIANGRIVQIKHAQVSDTGRYTCVATNIAGEDEKDFDVNIQGERVGLVLKCLQGLMLWGFYYSRVKVSVIKEILKLGFEFFFHFSSSSTTFQQAWWSQQHIIHPRLWKGSSQCYTEQSNRSVLWDQCCTPSDPHLVQRWETPFL